MLDLVDISRRGIEEGKNRPELSLYGWAMNALDKDGREWDESAVHVSDYKAILRPDDRKCHRQLWHRFQGDERADDSLWKEIMFDQGDAMATRFAYYISLGLPEQWQIFGIEVDCEDYLPTETDVGSADLVLWNPGTQEFLVVEIKTQRGRGIQHIKSEGRPKESHMVQDQGYLYALTRRFEDEFDDPDVKGCVFYLDREGQNPPIYFPVDRNDARIEEASQLANEIKGKTEAPDIMKLGAEISRNKTTSDSVYMDIPWQCSHCDYRGVSCPGAVSEDMEYTNKLGELENGNVIVTADVNGDKGQYKELINEAINEGRVVEK